MSECGGNGTVNSTASPVSDYRAEMRSFVEGISAWTKGLDSGFIIIPQNGHDLLTVDGRETGAADGAYAAAIDGVGRERPLLRV